jgi:biotin carboxyl carrier protein
MTDPTKDYSISINDQHDFELSEKRLSEADIIYCGNGKYHLILNDKSFEFEVSSLNINAKTLLIRSKGKMYEVRIQDQLDHLISSLGLEVEDSGADSDVKAPMPGLVLEVFVKPGDEVDTDDQLLILEAMKMENVIKASGSGTVDEVKVQKGDGVEKGQVLVTFV